MYLNERVESIEKGMKYKKGVLFDYISNNKSCILSKTLSGGFMVGDEVLFLVTDIIDDIYIIESDTKKIIL